MTRLFFTFAFLLLFLPLAAAQTVKPKSAAANALPNPVKSSAAYSETLLRKVEIEAELEELLFAYKEEHPRVKEAQFKLNSINRAVEKILSVNSSEASKLTAALGKLLVRKSELEFEVWKFRQQFNDEHPDVKRARRKVEIFDKAVKEILP